MWCTVMWCIVMQFPVCVWTWLSLKRTYALHLYSIHSLRLRFRETPTACVEEDEPCSCMTVARGYSYSGTSLHIQWIPSIRTPTSFNEDTHSIQCCGVPCSMMELYVCKATQAWNVDTSELLIRTFWLAAVPKASAIVHVVTFIAIPCCLLASGIILWLYMNQPLQQK